ncbi:MAG: hypothetical protein VR72_20425 [Clostridiaceae bacterium BRH_c20a]|nr:MAG: hypothetical protein VR72_20425 [Clostridiaceae bacterium BRH_c20a]
MARRPRVEYPGALYHVICRGNNGEDILSQEKDKIEYIEILKKYKIRYGFNLYAYCIMDNHVHLLVETGVIPLSKIMQGIQQSFTQRYNKRYQRTGHVFQQRYKAKLCDMENYLLQLIKYIHHNPIKARISGLSYNWSSHYNYAKGLGNSLVDVESILNLLSEDRNRAIKLYRSLWNFRRMN